jgi:hypothetical protein
MFFEIGSFYGFLGAGLDFCDRTQYPPGYGHPAQCGAFYTRHLAPITTASNVCLCIPQATNAERIDRCSGLPVAETLVNRFDEGSTDTLEKSNQQ